MTQKINISPEMDIGRDQNNNISMLSKRSIKPLVYAQLENMDLQFMRLQADRITSELRVIDIRDKKAMESLKGSRLGLPEKLTSLINSPINRPESNMKIG